MVQTVLRIFRLWQYRTTYYCTVVHARYSTALVYDRNEENVCVCVFSSHSFWTSSSLDVPAGVTQDFSSAFFLRCVPSFFSREGFSHSFPSSTVKSNFVY